MTPVTPWGLLCALLRPPQRLNLATLCGPVPPAAEDALRASGAPFAIVRPVALTEEPAGMPLVFDQGDTLKGKVSREASRARGALRVLTAGDSPPGGAAGLPGRRPLCM